MRCLPFLAILLPFTARADDGARLTLCELADCPVNLTAGQDYMLKAGETNGDGTGGTLIDPSGRAVAFVPYNGDGSGYINYRAEFSATYTVRADGTAPVELFTDCRGDDQTNCSAVIGSPVTGVSTAVNDRDAFRMHLVAGHSYVWTFPTYFELRVAVVNSRGVTLRSNHTGRIEFRPPANGVYYLVVDRSRGNPYKVTMK